MEPRFIVHTNIKLNGQADEMCSEAWEDFFADLQCMFDIYDSDGAAFVRCDDIDWGRFYYLVKLILSRKFIGECLGTRMWMRYVQIASLIGPTNLSRTFVTRRHGFPLKTLTMRHSWTELMAITLWLEAFIGIAFSFGLT